LLNKGKQVVQNEQTVIADSEAIKVVQKEHRKSATEWRVVKKPEIVNLETSSLRNKEYVELENEINVAIEARNAAFGRKDSVNLANKVQEQVEAHQSSSDETEFVDNTINNDEPECSLKSTYNVPFKDAIEHKDIDFLKNSWANLAELEATADPLDMLLDAQENNSHSDSTQTPYDYLNLIDEYGFQQVISKGTKKAIKAAQLKRYYITRSKVGSKSPFI